MITGIEASPDSLRLYKEKSIQYEDVFNILSKCIKEKKAFSLVRLGDGENCILAYPEYVEEKQYDWVISRAFGHSKFSQNDYIDMQEKLKVSTKSADIIGIYPANNPNTLLGTSIPLMELRNCYNQQPLSTAWVNYDLYENNKLSELLANQSIGIISCRDIGKDLERAFHLKVSHFYSIAEEAQYHARSLEKTIKTTMPHYPDRFQEIGETIQIDFPGQIYLVGAGHLGKYYCHIIKKQGGIALDVGSLFDSWAGIYTRTCHGKGDPEQVILPKWRLIKAKKISPLTRLITGLKNIFST